MRGISGMLAWGVRWETVDRADGVPVYGMLLPEAYGTRRQARRAQRRMARLHPYQTNPFGAGDRLRVRYVVFARPAREVSGS
ncbi:MAG TPA: hypothetical protein VIG08_17520 [Gemmatimonadales bacterium]